MLRAVWRSTTWSFPGNSRLPWYRCTDNLSEPDLLLGPCRSLSIPSPKHTLPAAPQARVMMLEKNSAQISAELIDRLAGKGP